MVYPEALFGHKWMRPIYGDPEYIVREIWRMENGWWDRNPTHLHPARPAETANAVLSALDNPGHVLDEARRLQAEGDTQLALHVIDLLALADPVIPEVIAARALKAALCRQRAEQMRSIVSRQILLSSAEDLLEICAESNSRIIAATLFASRSVPCESSVAYSETRSRASRARVGFGVFDRRKCF